DGPWVVVTTLGLWLPDRPRLGWHQIHKATWSGARLTVVPAVPVGDGGTYTVMADDAPVTAHLADAGDVPAAVRARVTRSVAVTAGGPAVARWAGWPGGCRAWPACPGMPAMTRAPPRPTPAWSRQPPRSSPRPPTPCGRRTRSPSPSRLLPRPAFEGASQRIDS